MSTGPLLPNEELYLVYVGISGEKDDSPIYTFYFSSTPESAMGPGWETICYANVKPPHSHFIHAQATLWSDKVLLGVLEEQEGVRYLDGVYGAFCLAYEMVPDYGEVNLEELKLMIFWFNDSMEKVADTLASRNLTLRFD